MPVEITRSVRSHRKDRVRHVTVPFLTSAFVVGQPRASTISANGRISEARRIDGLDETQGFASGGRTEANAVIEQRNAVVPSLLSPISHGASSHRPLNLTRSF